ncbi:MAG: NAD(P)/FAD-dependent oxidoreductase [Bacteroidota bacterium]
MHDIIIIGGGPAGSTAATLLARQGYKTLVLEKAKFPREHVGESLLPFCYPILEELGVLPQMQKGYVRKPGATFSSIDGKDETHYCFGKVIEGPEYLSFHIHRARFDHMLLENSRNNGVEVLEEMTVRKVDFESLSDGAVVHVDDKEGRAHTFPSRFVIDASGQDSLLANQMETRVPFDQLHRRVAYSTHWKNAKLNDSLQAGNINIVHLEGEKLGWIWMIPVTEDRLSVGLAVNMSYAKAQKKASPVKRSEFKEWFYLKEIQSSPLVAEIIEGAERANPVAVNGDFSYYSTRKFGDRFALIGDASGFIDPIFSSGIYLSMKSAQLLAESLPKWLEQSDKLPMKEVYDSINGAYELVEKMVTTFYDPNSIRFEDVHKLQVYDYEKFIAGMSIWHLVLAGDFFTNYKKYIKAVGLLNNDRKIDQFKKLAGYEQDESANVICVARNVQQQLSSNASR